MSGSYERVLHDPIEEMIARLAGGGTFVDLGCADGYYAVGVARAAPAADVHAFDLSRVARRKTAALARVNDVRVHLHSRADEGTVVSLGPSCVVCDIEGGEADVLTRRLAESLHDALIVAELHESIRPGVTGLVVARFSGTHDVRIVEAEDEALT